MEYYDLSDILMREEKIGVSFPYKIDFFGISVLEEQDCLKDAALELPMFALDFILENEHCQVKTIPIDEELKHALRAKASIVDLRKMFANFHGFTLAIYKDEVSKRFFKEVFVNRIRDFAEKVITDDISEKDIERMDINEINLIWMLENGINNFSKIKDWMKG